jgi:tRNA (cmo5U34)-methyltransferase
MENRFDNIAKNWDKNQIHIQRTEAIAKALIKRCELNPRMKALEFGAGTGLLSFALKDYFSEITLMDSSVEMINTTKDKLIESGIKHLHPVFFDLEKNDYTEKTFDFIFSQMALHHVVDIEKILLKFHHLLNAGGQIAIADLYTEDGTFHDADFTGHYGFKPDNLATLMEEIGFHAIQHHPCFVINRMDENGSEKEFLIFLLTAKKETN